MLEELHVRNLALIEEAWLEFGPGMTVLTGETGAGKTALVGAIQLLVGERADSQMVRAGAEEALVEGRIVNAGEDRVLKRRVSSDGRSRCQIDGEMVSVGTLASQVGPLFDLHGQHDHQALLHPSNHAAYLDRYVGSDADDAHEGYRQAYAEYAQAVSALERFDAALREDRERADYLTFVAGEIEGAGLTEGEDEALRARVPALRYGEKLSAAASAALGLLRQEGAASDMLASAGAELTRVHGLDPALDALTERVTEAASLVDDIGMSIREYAETIEHDPAALNEVEARLSVLAELKKKYGPSLEEVLKTGADAKSRLASIDDGEFGRAEAERRMSGASAALTTAGERLVSIRQAAEPGFLKALAAESAELGMGGTRFGLDLSVLAFSDWTADGPMRIEFLVAAGEDQPLRPLAKIASGGEVSRVMLALKTVLGAADRVPILVFDEVDAGIGGATAIEVGRKLSHLARDRQVLVITHLAQVAAFADTHMVVRKVTDGGSVRTSVITVEGKERVAEVARMLAGGDSEVGVRHAEELLGNARTGSTSL